ncbi:MAG: hypothetical protein V4506_13790 [Bacteroidota bacterium]
MEKVTLFYLESTDIKISMQIYFTEKGQLYFDGYDIGKFVKETFGDSDYEYTYTIEPEELTKFYELFNLEIGDKSGLLQAIKLRFSVNEAYSLFGKFMQENAIKYSSFTWR